MVAPDISKYIPVGILRLGRWERSIPSDLWSSEDSHQWRHFPLAGSGSSDDPITVSTGSSYPTPPPSQPSSFLPPELQELLLSHTTLAPYRDLLLRRWIHCSLAISQDEGSDFGIVRVYLLPDDVDRRLVDRSDISLQKARTQLLSKLDYSARAWSSPSLDEASSPSSPSGSESPTLLHLFNAIPSPDPQPSAVRDDYTRSTMSALLSSTIPGLKTSLYPYQRRSAALMLQREKDPEQFLDPRLVRTTDQEGGTWYYDAVKGAGLRSPRMYDGPKGGILAEEMGSGKTLICLALILASRGMVSKTPEIYIEAAAKVRREKVGSLADMAAAVVTKYSVPWDCLTASGGGVEYTGCVEAIRNNPGWYNLPPPQRIRATRREQVSLPPQRIYNSNASLIVVPVNLVAQWRAEIAKHTEGLVVVAIAGNNMGVPDLEALRKTDIVLFSRTRFDRLKQDCGTTDANGCFVLKSPLAQIQFKRCIIDEGHHLGNAGGGAAMSDAQLVVNSLQICARWAVTGTPSKGLYGVDTAEVGEENSPGKKNAKRRAPSSKMEQDDLRRIGSIARNYLRVRPWANTAAEAGDTPADWNTYVLQPRHSARSLGRQDCLRSTLESLIIRHPLSETGKLLPDVREKVVYLDGSYQDKLALNLFAMMIIANAVQSQRTDADYFFHKSQRKQLKLLVHNLQQASFFGGSFFQPENILNTIGTAEAFLEDEKRTVEISAEDEEMLREAVAFGKLAAGNKLKGLASMWHEVPVLVENFPGGKAQAQAWSQDDSDSSTDGVITDSRLILAMQKFLAPTIAAPAGLQLLLDSGRFAAAGRAEKRKTLDPDGVPREQVGFSVDPNAIRRREKKTRRGGPTWMDGPRGKGNAYLGRDRHHLTHVKDATLEDGEAGSSANGSGSRKGKGKEKGREDVEEVADALKKTQIIATTSAKLSYLVDQIVRFQAEEQIIVFYENENVAWYLAGMLENLQIPNLIYARDLSAQRRSQYVVTFNSSPKFRVMIMDIRQAAFGLDMRSVSRIYFINPVFDPAVEAQAIGRAKRISQKKPVTVETLVLRGSLEEVIVRRREEITVEERRKCKDILDDGVVFGWIKSVKMIPMPTLRKDEGKGKGKEVDVDGNDTVAEMAPLKVPQKLFGRGNSTIPGHPDDDLVAMPQTPKKTMDLPVAKTASATPGMTSTTLTPDLARASLFGSPVGNLSGKKRKTVGFTAAEPTPPASASGASTEDENQDEHVGGGDMSPSPPEDMSMETEQHTEKLESPSSRKRKAVGFAEDSDSHVTASAFGNGSSSDTVMEDAGGDSRVVVNAGTPTPKKRARVAFSGVEWFAVE